MEYISEKFRLSEYSDGQTPYIQNNEWYIGNTPTGVKAVGTDGGSLQVRYQNAETIEDLDLDSSKWQPTMPSPEQNKSTFMQQKLSNQAEDAWSRPIQISAEDGQPGKDGTNIEYVYYRSQEVLEDPIPPSYTNEVLTQGWTKSPQGITSVDKYEYVSIRTKAADQDWSSFSAPVIWSKWGEKGFDGDGIKYLYCLISGTTEPTTPPSWPTPENQTYIWTDDPSGVTANNRFEYVVAIRTIIDPETGNKTETQSATGALWSKYSVDGKDAIAILSLSLSNDSDLVPATSTGVDEKTALGGAKTTVTAFKYGVPNNNATIVCSVAAYTGGSLNEVITTEHYSYNDKTFQLNTWKNIWDSVIATFSYTDTNDEGESVTITKDFVMTKFLAEKGATGDAAVDYSLKITPKTFNATLTASPQITVQLLKIVGSDSMDITESAIQTKNLTFAYDGTNHSNLTSNTFTWKKGQTGATIRYKIKDGIYETERIEAVSNGEPGSSPYSIELSNDSATIGTNNKGEYKSDLLEKVSKVEFRVFEGSEEITDDCDFSLAVDGGTVKWEEGTNVFCFTELSADTATATITVTDIGSKTFTISKVKQGEQGIQGEQGTGVSVKASADDCKEIGDGYIDADGNLQIITGFNQDGTKIFTNGGQIKGPKGDAQYLHIAYASSSDGQKDFSTSNPTDRTYIGTYVDNQTEDSQDSGKYTWKKWEGDAAVTYTLTITPNGFNISESPEGIVPKFYVTKYVGNSAQIADIDEYQIRKANTDNAWVITDPITQETTFELYIKDASGDFNIKVDSETVGMVSNGEDSTVPGPSISIETEYAYYLNNNSTTPGAPTGEISVSSNPDTGASGQTKVWTKIPSGVTSNYPYEFQASRKITTTTSNGQVIKTEKEEWGGVQLYASYYQDVQVINTFNALTGGSSQFGVFGQKDGQCYINANFIQSGAFTVKDTENGTVLFEAGFPNGQTNGRVSIAGWNVDKDSISKGDALIYSGDEEKYHLPSLTNIGTSPIRFGSGQSAYVENYKTEQWLIPYNEVSDVTPDPEEGEETPTNREYEIEVALDENPKDIKKCLCDIIFENGDIQSITASFSVDSTLVKINFSSEAEFQKIQINIKYTYLVISQKTFAVLEDGSMYSTGAKIAGDIEAKTLSTAPIYDYTTSIDIIQKRNTTLTNIVTNKSREKTFSFLATPDILTFWEAIKNQNDKNQYVSASVINFTTNSTVVNSVAVTVGEIGFNEQSKLLQITTELKVLNIDPNISDTVNSIIVDIKFEFKVNDVTISEQPSFSTDENGQVKFQVGQLGCWKLDNFGLHGSTYDPNGNLYTISLTPNGISAKPNISGDSYNFSWFDLFSSLPASTNLAMIAETSFEEEI